MQRLAADSPVVIGTACPVQRSTYMSSRADIYRQRAADAKNRATQAKDLFIKSAFEHVAAGWVALAEQAERIDREKFPVRDEKITARSPNRARRRHLGVYPHHHGNGMRRSDVGGRETDRAPAPTWLRGREPWASCGRRSAGRCVQPRSDCRHRTPQ
jgi:hypothetical protein